VTKRLTRTWGSSMLGDSGWHRSHFILVKR